ncbi:MAG: hypothetical protein HWN51_00035 [Desulfobacterales bacterium]|nr:hypothetical protein [Desulfobacterales bacterium]
MDIKVMGRSNTERGRRIKAATEKLDIIIDLERVTSRATQIKVNAKKGRVLKDKATAGEIINQVGKILEGGTWFYFPKKLPKTSRCHRRHPGIPHQLPQEKGHMAEAF